MDETTIQDLVDRLLAPKRQEVTFAGHKITMRPASIAVMKRLRRLSAEVQKGAVAQPGLEDDPLRQAELETVVADYMLQAVKELLEWYGIAMTKEQLENAISTAEAEQFLTLQFKLNEEEDFLSRAWNVIIRAYSERPRRLSPNL